MVLTLLATELVFRALVKPSRMAAGRLFGSELPPRRLVPPEPPARRAARAARTKAFRGDDLAGKFRPDPVVGYVPREDMVSSNGWWQTNNLGARSRVDTSRDVPPGKTRVLVFGDSFAVGSRVPQEAAWPAVLATMRPDLDVVSLGVDGYGAAQSYLRYRAVRDAVEHDVVVLTISPGADLWRDVNTLRALAGWRSYTVMPRYVLDGESLRLVPGPYDPPDAVYADNRDATSPRLRAHLERYDRFFVPWMYEAMPEPWGRSVLVRFGLARWHAAKLRDVQDAALAPDSEAVRVTAKIVATMRDEAIGRGTRFLLVMLPSEREVKALRRTRHRAQWRAVAAALSSGDVPCADLSDELLAIPPEELDRGADGTHHGPRVNARIAEMMERALPQIPRL